MVEKSQNKSTRAAKRETTSAIDVVWQWLTYGLWWFTLLSFSFMVTTLVAYYVDRYTTSSYDNVGGLIYVAVIALCLAGCAFFVDKYYSKSESDAKQGFSGVVMVLHAVLLFFSNLALCVTALILAIMLLKGAGENKTELIVNLLTCVLTLPFSVSLFLRIVRPNWVHSFVRYFKWVMVGAIIVTSILSLAGPFQFSNKIAQDNFIDTNLPVIDSFISDYAYYNNELPGSLFVAEQQLDDEDAKKLIDKKLVEYRIVQDIDQSLPHEEGDAQSYAYELCVNYRQRRGDVDSSILYYDMTAN